MMPKYTLYCYIHLEHSEAFQFLDIFAPSWLSMCATNSNTSSFIFKLSFTFLRSLTLATSCLTLSVIIKKWLK